MAACVVQIDGYDPVAGAAVTLYAGSHDDPAVCGLNGLTWWPALAKLPTLRYDLFDGAFGGAISTPSSSLTLQAEPWPNIGRYMLADARLRLWTGSVGDAWGSYTLRFDGRITGQPKLADGKAEVEFAVDDRWLDGALLATYAGTTGVEGPAALKGQVKPLALGAPRYVSGKLIDSVNSVFQVSAYGAVQAFEYALEKLARFGAATADYATYAALIAATLAPGTWATCNAAGLARFGAPPVGQISFLLSGDNSGTDGWARKPGQLIRRLAILSGGTGKVDDTSLNALDTARPYNVSLYLDEQTTAREAIQKLAASVNAVAGVSWTGQLFVLPVAIGAAAVTLAADGSSLPPSTSAQQIEIAAPFRKLALTAERAWTVHALSDIASTATLVDVGGYVAGTSYREGNIVELSDGSRYLYAAVTPTAGNTPPNATYWTPLPSAAPTDFANVVGAGKPETYTVAAKSNSASPPADFANGLRGAGGSAFVDPQGPTSSDYPRSYTVCWRDSPTTWFVRNFDVYGSEARPPADTGNGSGGMANLLNSLAAGTVVVIYTSDEPRQNRLSGGLPDAMLRCGASRAIFVNRNWHYRPAYVLIGQVGAGEGNGVELFADGGVDSSPASWVRTSFQIVNGIVTVGGQSLKDAADLAFSDGRSVDALVGVQAGADVTALAQVVVDQPAQAVVSCDYLGTPLSGELPRTIGTVVTRGGASITSDASVTYSATFSNLTGTVGTGAGGTTKGSHSVATLTANEGYLDVVVTVAGVAQPAKRTVVTKQLAQRPVTGGSGSSYATDTTLNPITSTSAVQISDTLTVTVASGQKLYGSGSPDYYIDGVYSSGSQFRTAMVYWAYRAAGSGGSFTAFAAGITGSQAKQSRYVGGDYTDPIPGSVNTAQNVTVSAGDYEVALFASMNATGPTMTWDTNGGAVMVEAKP